MPTQLLNQKSKRAAAAIAGIAAVSVGGMVALFGGEKPVHDDTALAVNTLVQPWEGRSLVAYMDKLAKPPVCTICDGDTTNCRIGMVETQQGCNKRLAVKMERDYRAPLTQCINGWEGRPIAWRAMMLSLAWNIGTGAACNSTAAKLGRAGQYLASCNAATAFNKAGGKVIIGIVRRRENGDATRIGEGELCATGVSG